MSQAELRGLKVLPPHGVWVAEATSSREDSVQVICITSIQDNNLSLEICHRKGVFFVNLSIEKYMYSELLKIRAFRISIM